MHARYPLALLIAVGLFSLCATESGTAQQGPYKRITGEVRKLRDVQGDFWGRRPSIKLGRISEQENLDILWSISTGRPLRSLDLIAVGTRPLDSTEAPLKVQYEEYTDYRPHATFEAGTAKGNAGPEQVGLLHGVGYESEDELTVGFNYMLNAAFRHYSLHPRPEEPQLIDDVPRFEWGVELKNGFEELNYPSIWGGRLGLNLLLGMGPYVRLGLVAPQPRFNGRGPNEQASAIGLFNVAEQRILGGWGASGGAYFAAPALFNSGGFDIFGTYTFSPAYTESIRAGEVNAIGAGQTTFVPGETGTLIRYAALAHYSFGFSLDRDRKFLFLIKIGGTLYGVDQVTRRPSDGDIALGDTAAEAQMLPVGETYETESFGGVSGSIDFMKSGGAFPFGIGVRYFDESILAKAWLQFFYSEYLDLKFEGQFFTPIVRDPRAWEPGTGRIFVPSVTLVYHFPVWSN